MNSWHQVSVFCCPHLESVMERDRYMSPMEAQDFGIIDKVLVHPPQAGQDEPELIQKEPTSPASTSTSPQPQASEPGQSGSNPPSSYKPEPWKRLPAGASELLRHWFSVCFGRCLRGQSPAHTSNLNLVTFLLYLFLSITKPSPETVLESGLNRCKCKDTQSSPYICMMHK